MAEAEHGQEIPHGRRTPIVRLVVAWVFTVLALPYAWGRSFIATQLTGAPEFVFLTICVVVMSIVVALSAGLMARPPRAAWLRWVLPAVAATWVAVNVVIFWSAVTSAVPRQYIIAGYVPGSLLVPWLAWMFAGPWRWATRLGVAAVLAVLLGIFVAVFQVDGLAGDSRVQFSLRARAADALLPLPARSSHASDAVPADALRIDPQRDYPQFLGPDRTGVGARSSFASDWVRRPPRELWRRPVGAGWSSFAVVGDYAFTQEQRGDSECVVCYRVDSGEEVWVHADAVHFTSSLGGPGPRATPTLHDQHVYTIGATGLLNCLEASTGKRVWSRDILEDHSAENIAHGVCASPLILDDWVVVCPTGERGPSLAAYDRSTGTPAWSGGTRAASYSSPAVAELHGVAQILLFDSAGLTAHEIGSGKPLWHFPWTNSVKVNVGQPIVHAATDNQVLVTTGYDKGCALVRVDRSADGSWSVEPVWSNNRLKTKFCSAVLFGEHAYGLDDGIMVCIDLATGERAWKAGRYGHGQILLAGELLVVQAEQGDVVLVRPSPRELREVGRISALSAKTWNNPVVAGRFLLVRNDQEAVGYELPAPEEVEHESER